jgi:hypothetical protein
LSDKITSASAPARAHDFASNFTTGRNWLLFYLKKYRWRLIFGTLFVLVSVALGVLTPRYTGVAIDYLSARGA